MKIRKELLETLAKGQTPDNNRHSNGSETPSADEPCDERLIEAKSTLLISD